METKTIAIVLFALTYLSLLVFPKIRAYIALVSAAIFVILGILPLNQVLETVDWNVILMIAGTMGVVTLFIESKMPSLLADFIIEKTPNVKWAIVSLALFAGFISAFVDNVATVLMVAPVALTIAKKLKISPVPSVIAIAISSNLQGAATLVGDTTSILLGGHADMNFLDFFFFRGKPGLFWIVEIGALVSTFVLLFLFRKEKQPVKTMERTVVTDYFPTVLLVGIVVLLIIASFIPMEYKPATINGLICVGLMLLGVIRKFIIEKDTKVFGDVLKEIDYTTILLLAGLFIVIGGIKEAGVIEDISELFIKASKDNVFVIFTLIVWASVIISAFIDNIPYVATMLPVTQGIAAALNIDPYILYFGLLIGATLGGNITPIGASANITGIGILRKEGYEVSAKQFMKISVPFTLAAVATGYILTWLIWK
ncbi:MAG: SLC13 family permease [Anaerocolumna aminovalerica]|uniref:SLC13 family permease n=1 Tax=Anaerocolumna aminovalerica TaxID=1527 RepID=UPI001C0EFE9D|nr:SLC13 family permease [Anaerocolumna aminovalerica]MBU5332257.1 TRAP transporter large permease subunit [Anaerocolumna aminovalerica]MDU6266328.1 SLC13 family permease [Anaerocolumna aminovalerica]